MSDLDHTLDYPTELPAPGEQGCTADELELMRLRSRVRELEQHARPVQAALASWVRCMDSMSQDPEDPATAIREQYHGKRLAESRAALEQLAKVLP